MIVMEFAAGGELFDRICDRGRFSEDEVSEFVSDFMLTFWWKSDTELFSA